jgi:N-acylglucosamine-6-phosphate 2-epimerase
LQKDRQKPMKMIDAPIVDRLHGGLIVSCQAPADSPLRDPEAIAAMAEAAVLRGAVGVRIESPDHVRAVRRRLPQVPIIGLWKRTFADSPVYITPRWQEITAIAEAGADIIAIDATDRPRPDGEDLATLIQRTQGELKLPVMADIDTTANGLRAARLGVAILGTTLYGYTEATAQLTPPGLGVLMELVDQSDCPVICEGGIHHPAQAAMALAQGAWAVVVGTAITGIDQKVMDFQRAIVELSND